jgi:putative Holliday junction resolvase
MRVVRILALDYGEQRIGAAVTDPMGIVAQPLETIARRSRDGGALEAIARLVRDYEVEQIVLGLPLHMDGRPGEQAAAVQRFGRQIAERTGVPVEYLDERWTTVEASRALGELGVTGAKRRAHLDAAAAAILLRTFLERRSARCGSPS